MFSNKEFRELQKGEMKHYLTQRLYHGYGHAFYLQLYVRNVEYRNLLSDFSENDLELLLRTCKVSKKEKEKYNKLYLEFRALNEEKQKLLQEVLLDNSLKYRNE